MIPILSILYLIPFFILSLLYSGQFLIIFFGYFLRLAILLSQQTNSSDQAFIFYLIDNFIRSIAAILIILVTKSYKNISLKSLKFTKFFSLSLQKFAFNKQLVISLVFTQLIFIIYVLVVSPDLSILSFNRNSTISLTVPGIRYVYPFVLALSPAAFAGSLLSVINYRELRMNFLHYLLVVLSLINIFLIGQRGFLLITLFISFLTSFLFSLYEFIMMGKLNISKLKYWFIVLFSFPIIYNLRSLNKLRENKLFFLKVADLEQIKAWEGAIDVVQNLKTSYPPIFNNVFNFLNHQSRIDLGVPNSSDIINDFLNLYGYFDKGFGLNITIPIDLYVSFRGDWLWMAFLLIYYTFILYRFIKSTEYFLFKKNSLISYFLVSCAFTLLFAGLGGWPLAFIFFLQAHTITSFKIKKPFKFLKKVI